MVRRRWIQPWAVPPIQYSQRPRLRSRGGLARRLRVLGVTRGGNSLARCSQPSPTAGDCAKQQTDMENPHTVADSAKHNAASPTIAAQGVILKFSALIQNPLGAYSTIVFPHCYLLLGVQNRQKLGYSCPAPDRSR